MSHQPMTDATNEPKTILALDDEVQNNNLVVRILRDWDVHTFTSPNEALVAARELPLAAMVVDYRMPEMNGLDFIRACRRDGVDASALMVTAFPDLDELTYSEQVSLLYRVIPKPINASYLEEHVNLVVAETRFRRKLEGRRKFARITVDLPATVACEGADEIAVQVKDLSLGGAGVVGPVAVAKGELVRLKLDAEPSAIAIRARVIYVGRDEAGLQFEEPDVEVRRTLGDIINKLLYDSRLLAPRF